MEPVTPEATLERLPPKQVIVMRADLKMQRGKEIAQGAHASMAFISHRLQAVTDRTAWENELYDVPGEYRLSLRPVEDQWLRNGRFTKIALAVDSEQALDDIYAKAKAAGLEVHMIVDSGMTVFHGVPTKTCLAIGPDLPEKIDPITKGLKLR